MGTAEDSFIDLTERIGRKTGGLSISPSVMSKRGSEEPIAHITVRPAALGGTHMHTPALSQLRLHGQPMFVHMYALQTEAVPPLPPVIAPASAGARQGYG